MQLIGFADRTALIPVSTDDKPDGRTGAKLTRFSAMVIHETANEDPEATAEMHRRYWNPGGGGALISSVQFVADAHESIQLIPIDEQAWHAGDVTGNTTGVGIEICVNSRAGFPAACRKAALVTARVIHAEGTVPVVGATVRKHGSYPGTTHRNCPQHLNAGDWAVTWAQFMDMVKQEYAVLIGFDYPALWGTVYPYFATSGIATEWRRAATTLGAATSDEHSDSAGKVWRLFMNGAVSYDPKTGALRSYFPRPT
jgi:hypothetical protein